MRPQRSPEALPPPQGKERRLQHGEANSASNREQARDYRFDLGSKTSLRASLRSLDARLHKLFNGAPMIGQGFDARRRRRDS